MDVSIVTYPIQINTLDQCARSLVRFHGDFQYAIDVHVVAFDELTPGRIWHRPSNQDTLIQLPFKC